MINKWISGQMPCRAIKVGDVPWSMVSILLDIDITGYIPNQLIYNMITWVCLQGTGVLHIKDTTKNGMPGYL